MNTTIIIISVILVFILLFIFNPYRRPLPTESDYSHHISPLWELYYFTRYAHSVKRAQRGSGLEDFFSSTRKPRYSDILSERKIVTIKAVGDLMTRRDLAAPASRHLWEDVGPWLFDADLCMGNLEFAVNPDRVIERILRYSVPANYAEPLLGDKRFGRFHIVSTANNHINDSFSQGIISTADYLDSVGVAHVGANRTPEEVDAFPILERNGIKFAFLSYTFSTNGIPLQKDFSHGTNLIRFNALRDRDYDPALIHHHIQCARRRGADIIIASHHWGVEFEYYPQARLVKRAHDLLDAGIDVIVGHHPHILNLSEWYTAKDGRQTLCLYSLGNITSWALKRPSQKMAMIAGISVETGRDADGRKITRLKDVSLMPTYFLIRGSGQRADHRIIPLLSHAEACRQGKRPAPLRGWDARVITSLEKEFNKYFRQDKAFTYL